MSLDDFFDLDKLKDVPKQPDLVWDKNEIGPWTTLDKLFPTFELTLDEGRALNKLLLLHHGLMRESPQEYEQILRLINGLGQWVDKHDKG